MTDIEILSGPVKLRPARRGDFAAWTTTREASRAHLTKWEPDWTPGDMSKAAFRQRLRHQSKAIRAGAALPLLVFDRSNDALVGGVTLSQIRRGPSCSATLGYWIAADYVRRGFARAAVRGVLDHAFNRMGLNRIEAACQPENEASRRLLAAAGFSEEGFARDYLNINGAWRDHLLFAITQSDYRNAAKPTG